MAELATPPPPPTPAPAPAPKPPANVMPPEKAVPAGIRKVFAKHTEGTLLPNRLWPTDVWPNPWKSASYRRGALVLSALILAGTGAAFFLREIGVPLAALRETLHRFAEANLPQVPSWAAEAVWILAKALVVLHIILFNGLFLVWWERKISAHMQSRLGPIFTGKWHGVLQTAADGIKLLLKEDAAPKEKDSWLHSLAPALVFVPVLICFTPVPWGRDLEAANLDAGVLYIFAWAGLSVLGIVLAGWASANKYSLLGGLRSAAQFVSYELPRSFSLVPLIAIAGSLSLTKIAGYQEGYWFGFFPKWFLFYPVVGQISFVIFLIASVAETNRTPFDIAEAESELVGGFHTEYSGMKFSIFFLTEYAYVLLASCLLTTFFMGGGAAPLPFLSVLPSWFWFLGKTLFFMFCFLWFRWTFPRFKIDRLLDFNWKFLLPWSFVNIVLALPYIYLWKL
ncbi:MAG: NADH-quinone oxidoreductase subunit NuoH [Elusimicrobia bacterium]|nr:NADH-quinone oxidoreductase subunit NuoH [Elusimicrobiota bacterium]